jgi:hypothetical protein
MSTEKCRCGHPIDIHAGTFGTEECSIQECGCLKFVSATSAPAGESREAQREDVSSLDDDLCKRAGHVSRAEAREILHRFCNSHFNRPNSERPRITIPADPRRDDDLRMIAYIKQQSAPASPAEAGVERALTVLANIADKYDANELDGVARKTWGEHDEHTNPTPPDRIILYTGGVGRTLLTLADCLAARDALAALRAGTKQQPSPSPAVF